MRGGVLALVLLSSPVFSEGSYKLASDLLAIGYEVVPASQPFLFGLKKEAELYLCELNEFQSSESFLVRQSILEAIELRKEPLVKPVAVPVTCFSVG
jgi:hypothetical protein